MNEVRDATIHVLREIREELRTTRTVLSDRIDQTNRRLDGLSERVDGLSDRVDLTNKRLVESEVRLATAITSLAGDVQALTGHLRKQADLRPRVEKCERDIEKIKRKHLRLVPDPGSER